MESCILSKFYIKPQRKGTHKRARYGCILSKFYIKPQLRLERELARCSCILSKFYIKPQPSSLLSCVVCCCILSKFYIKPQQQRSLDIFGVSCILSKFYIKPQHARCRSWLFGVVSYRNSTSNHNSGPSRNLGYKLYLIEILHQTTTYDKTEINQSSCILSKFYIKPQLKVVHCLQSCRCILSKFYIKPQLGFAFFFQFIVVSYRNSTSNHNFRLLLRLRYLLYLIEILHQTTTENHSSFEVLSLYLIEILHQTTTSGLILIDKVLLTGCLPL